MDLTRCPYLEEGYYVVLDFETTNIDTGSALSRYNSLLLSCFARGESHYCGSCYVRDLPRLPSSEFEGGGGDGARVRSIWANEYGITELVDVISKARFIVAHNAKFELQWLARAGLDLSKTAVFDTLIAEYVLNAGVSVPLDLGSVAKRHGLPSKEVYVDKCMKAGICPSDIPKSLLEERCKYDVMVTEQIFLQQLQQLQETGQLEAMWTRCILTPVLADIEKNGMALSHDRVNAVYTDTFRTFNELEMRLREMTGGINLNSPKQKGEFIYETLGIAEPTKKGKPLRSPSGGYKTDTDTILSLKGRNKRQKEFLTLYAEYAKLNAKLSKSLNKYKECIDNNDLLLAQFNQTRTKTQRLSSSGRKYSIQFQNQAREFKPLFCARDPEWFIAEIDGAQLEFRVAAFLGQDKRAIDDIIDGFDVHSYTASVMTEAGQHTERQEAKAHTFKPLFGGQSGTEAEQTYYKAFREKYPGIAAAQQSWIDQALANQQVRTVTGLIYNYPGTTMSRSGYVNNTTQICNYPVQGFATADIIPIALTYLWHELRNRKLRSFIVNTIHDSAVLEVHPDEVEEVRKISVYCFTTAVYNYLKEVYNIEFNVPLGTGFKCGKYWTEGEEITESVESPFKWVS